MVVVCAGWLHVSMIVVDAEVHLAHRIVVPNVSSAITGTAARLAPRTIYDRLARSPDFGRARIEYDAVDGDPKGVSIDGSRLIVRVRLCRHFEAVMLRTD